MNFLKRIGNIKRLKFEHKIAGFYFVLAILWFLFSGKVFEKFISDYGFKFSNSFTESTDIVFILISSILIFILIRRHLSKNRKAENAIRESELTYINLFNSVTEAIYIQNEKGVFLDVNQGVVNMYGYSKDEIIGKTPEMLSAEGLNDINQIFSLVNNVFETGIPEKFEFWGKKKNGEVFPKDVITSKFKYFGKDVIITTARDVSKNKKIQSELIKAKDIAEESEQKVRSMFENTKAGILFFNPEGQILEANNAVLEIIGSPSIEFTKQINLLNFQPLIDVGFSGNAQKCISEKKVIASEATYTSKWGKTVYMQYFLIPIFVQNNIVGVWANLHNLTDLWNTKNDLIIAKEKAEESDKLKSAFLQNISHEVRTPLNSIVGFSQLITKKNQTPEKVQLYSDLIYSNSYKLIGIISDVIEISQIQSKQIHANYSMFDIILFIKSQFSEFINIVNEKNLRYNLTIEPNIEKYIIKSDEEKLRKIIYHIIDNSIKFTSKGKVDLSIKINEEKIVIAISDTGIGISDEMKKIIFMPFRQAEIGVIRNFGGNGLGLALAKSYIELLSGKIDLQSEINVGTTITLHLPVKEEKNDFYKNQKNYNKKNINTILIAEDEFSNYLLLIELMNSSELKILHALNGQQAVDFCRNGNDIDLILMDIKMPIMDGQEAAKVIKEFRPDIPIIAQSAYFEETEIEKYKDIFDDCIEKPINEKVLKEILEKYFLYSDKIKF